MYSPTSTPRVIVAPAVADLVPLTRLNARFLEIAFVLVHLDHVAVRIVNAHHSMMRERCNALLWRFVRRR
jgi:hypothetical protein